MSEHADFSRVQERKMAWDPRLQVYISSRREAGAVSEISVSKLIKQKEEEKSGTVTHACNHST